MLTELQKLINQKDDGSRFIDASNRFYTLIPHAFGIADPPIIKTEEMVKVSYQYLIKDFSEDFFCSKNLKCWTA